MSLLILPILPETASAHGAKIQYRQTSAISIQATYDDGTPMKQAQVVIYAPSDRATPWLKGTTDRKGQFDFVPDANISGDWDIKVRQSGHGDITSIPLTGGKIAVDPPQTESMSSSSKFSGSELSRPNGYTNLQKLVMATTGIWGFVGTALFFSRSKSAK